MSVTVSIKANPGISTFMFDLTYDKAKLYPVSYVKGDVLADAAVTTPLGSGESFEDKGSVRFLCQTSDTKNTDSDGDLITVVFRTRAEAECGNTEIAITEPSFINQDNEDVSFEQKNGVLAVTDYTIGDVNCDGSVDLKDSLMPVKYFTGFSVTPTEAGKKAAASIYPDGDDAEEPTLKDFQHLFRYLAGWQVELGRNGGAL